MTFLVLSILCSALFAPVCFIINIAMAILVSFFFLNFTLFIENGKLISDRHITSFTLEYINFKDYRCRIIYLIICVVFFVSAMNWSRLPTAGWCQFWSPSLLSMSWCLPLLQPPYVVVVPQSEPPRYTL